MDASGNQCSHSNPVVAKPAPTHVNSPASNNASGRSAAAANKVVRPAGAVGRERRLVVAEKPATTPVEGRQSASGDARTVKVSRSTGAN